MLSSALKAVCVVAQGRGASLGEVLSRHIGDAVVCNMNLEDGVICISKPLAEEICQRPFLLGKRGKI